MHIGISTPAVTLYPPTVSPWEEDATVDDLVQVAVTADRLGFDHLTCSEHIAVPTAVARERGGTYWDALATLSFLAGQTEQIRLATSVVVLGYHHPLALAKRYGTLDLLSGGRLVLGVGVGSLREEFDLLGAEFEGRGEIADDALRALRAALSGPLPRYEGSHFEFSDLVVSPHAQQEHVPFWIGGRTRRSLRRAAELGDGWMPFGLAPDEIRELLGGVPLPTPFDVVLPTPPLDPGADADGVRGVLRTLEEAGATHVTASLRAASAAHYVEQLNALRELMNHSDRVQWSSRHPAPTDAAARCGVTTDRE
jgi:probable F420-dependent oxidoreductase